MIVSTTRDPPTPSPAEADADWFALHPRRTYRVRAPMMSEVETRKKCGFPELSKNSVAATFRRDRQPRWFRKAYAAASRDKLSVTWTPARCTENGVGPWLRQVVIPTFRMLGISSDDAIVEELRSTFRAKDAARLEALYLESKDTNPAPQGGFAIFANPAAAPIALTAPANENSSTKRRKKTALQKAEADAKRKARAEDYINEFEDELDDVIDPLRSDELDSADCTALDDDGRPDPQAIDKVSEIRTYEKWEAEQAHRQLKLERSRRELALAATGRTRRAKSLIAALPDTVKEVARDYGLDDEFHTLLLAARIGRHWESNLPGFYSVRHQDNSRLDRAAIEERQISFLHRTAADRARPRRVVTANATDDARIAFAMDVEDAFRHADIASSNQIMRKHIEKLFANPEEADRYRHLFGFCEIDRGGDRPQGWQYVRSAMPTRHKDDAHTDANATDKDADATDFVDESCDDYLDRKYSQEEDTRQFRIGNGYERGECLYWEKLEIAEREFLDDLTQ